MLQEYHQVVEECDKIKVDYQILQMEHESSERGRIEAEKDSMQHYNALESKCTQLLLGTAICI